MKTFLSGERVRAVSSLSEINDAFRHLIPAPACEMLGELVTIRDQPIPDWPLYHIEEDGGRFLYPSSFFKPEKKKDKPQRHVWTEKELDTARGLICTLLAASDGRRNPDAYYRFVDLVTPYQDGKLTEGSPRVLLVRTSMQGLDIHVYSGISSPKDEPNLLVGMAVCLCKAKHVPIPDWILHPAEYKELAKCS